MNTRLVLLVLVLAAAGNASGDVSVTAVAPSANSIASNRSTPISATFSEPVDPGTLTPTRFTVFGLWSGVAPGEISLSNDGHTATFTPSRPFSAGERVTVSIAGAVASIDGTPLDHGYSWHFVVGTAPARLSPVEMTHVSVRRKGEGWIQTYGAYAGDFNEDGFLDLAVPNERSNDFRLFLNDGSGLYGDFDIYQIPSGSRPSVNEGADFDLDGHMDFIVGNSTGTTVALFMGDGTGTLVARGTFSVGSGVRGLAVLDLNGDNYPDVVTAGRQGSVVSTLINDGTGSFLPAVTFATPASGETAVAAADMNEDGVMDVVVGAYESDDVVVLLSDGNGALNFHGRYPAGGSVWMVVSGDMNGDGHADVVSSNSNDASVSVLLGDGTGSLGPPDIYESDVFTIAIDVGDLDGDGDLDMVASNFGESTVDSGHGSWRIYANDGQAHFVPGETFESDGAGSCVVLHDRNGDGTLDITAIDELQDQLVLFTNHPIESSVEDRALPANRIDLKVYPNPMFDRTVIDYVAETSDELLIELFDIAGRRVATYSDGRPTVGSHRWILDLGASGVPAGAYFVTLSAGTRRASIPVWKAR